MNDRLRRRIREIKEYIDKMELENKKIEEDSKIDLTKKFKQDYLVGKIIG